jgi:Rps23 Pro-64 3,4-dihydroxylase Tpa1-like proline 4-hydroxylase
MKYNIINDPIEFITIDNFFNSTELKNVKQEINTYENEFEPGLYQRDGVEILDIKMKKNKIIWLKHNKESYILKTLAKKWFSKKNMNFLKNLDNPIFESLSETTSDNTQISCYGNGDYYNYHKDAVSESVFLTLVIMICNEPKQFTGGDLIFKRNKNTAIVPFKDNIGILFPSRILHKVTPIKLKDNQFKNKRFTIQNWAHIR